MMLEAESISGQELVVDSYKHGNEPSDSIRVGESIDYLYDS